jgi:hypothetical protein
VESANQRSSHPKRTIIDNRENGKGGTRRVYWVLTTSKYEENEENGGEGTALIYTRKRPVPYTALPARAPGPMCLISCDKNLNLVGVKDYEAPACLEAIYVSGFGFTHPGGHGASHKALCFERRDH